MTVQKRILDIILSLLGLSIFWPIMLVIAAMILIRDGRPILFGTQRMKTHNQLFTLWKFRTMTPGADDGGGVSGADKDHRITPLGRILRKYRLDELPQLWNILLGEMSFVGPRPPLPRYVDLFPDLYQDVLKNRPGITGLATLAFHKHEEIILAQATSADQTDQIYRRRCVPQKARLDRIYAAHSSICFDLWLIWKTIAKVMRF
ncbi:sugar transferase [Parasulfitobacter algicola]|uniref:Sugar transferase n=1 Tax=Parasulfitobacter algicola TaxID=2614809 RepID=A0ABX2IVQ1_9RHOB|nr:sugar transferase [Sulfitobacter algicola]NSX56580.1 sugar transferase [Sulfitobacter algicola]